MADNRLVLAGKTFDGTDPDDRVLDSAKCHLGNNLVGDALGVDSLTAVVRDYDTQPRLLAADGLLAAADGMLAAGVLSNVRLDRSLAYGDVAQCYHGETLIGRFRVESVKRVGKYAYQVESISDLGLLETSYHYGGIYAGQSLGAVLADIVGGVIPYSLDGTLAAVPVYGLLKKRTRRDNLRDLLFAYGGALGKDSAGLLTITPMAAKTAVPVALERWYQAGSVTDGNPATRLEVTEHAYSALASDPEVVLFEGESAAEAMTTPKGAKVTGILVEFQEPMHDLRATNVSLLEQGANYAVLSGSPAGRLVGRQYTHTERVLTRQSSGGGSPNVVVTKECTLVNLMNAENVADRLWSYYSSGKTVKGSFVLEGERPGDNVQFTDVFGDATSGYVSAMDLTLSAIVKAESTIIADYTPTGSGNYYTRVAVLLADGNWTAPADVRGKIRAVIIGGGQGGWPGANGGNGQAGRSGSNGDSGKGGKGGQPGSAGRVLVVTLAASAGQTFYAHIGKGSDGANVGSAPAAGGASTFAGYSSDQGYVPGTGYQDLINGTLYAPPGNAGVAGSDGGNASGRPSVSYGGKTWTAGTTGASSTYGSAVGYGGYGGGAAVGNTGGNGSAGRAREQSNNTTFADGGAAGNGASAVAAENATVRGGGGNGGHGGGGGGGGGGYSPGTAGGWPGNAGVGGGASKGGRGADGIILIYY